MTEPVDPRSREFLKNTDAFFAIGFVFFVLGLSGDNNAAFLAIGLAFIVIGVAGRARKPKGDQ
jgi:hypothetical protein